MQNNSSKSPDDNIVAAFTDVKDKYALLETVLAASRFFERLERAWKNSGKSKSEFKIVIKPNITMMLRRTDIGTYTDPYLLVHILRLLLKSGYSNLTVVESQNLYGNWFGNRAVIQIAARAGYFAESIVASYDGRKQEYIHVFGDGVDARIPLIDLTLDMVAYDFGPPFGEVELGKTWIEADFRLNLAKIKTHFYSYYTLAIKNVYGCLPKQDKVRNYHCKRLVASMTARLIKHFPVHFSILDGFSSADGWFGVKMKAIPNKTHTIVAGADIMALDHYGAGLMGLDARKSILYFHLEKYLESRPYEVIGNARPFKPWRNPPGIFAQFCMLIEPFANIMDYSGSVATGGHDDCFPITHYKANLFRRIFHFITQPVNIILDIEFAVLRIRELIFRRRLKLQKSRLPLLSNSEYLIDRLSLLGRNEFLKLIELLENCDSSPMRNSGHYVMNETFDKPLSCPMTTSNIAIVEIINHVLHNRLDKLAVISQLQELLWLCPKLFSSSELYPYCYR